VRDAPVARATADTPPRPSARASTPSQRRRCRSSSSGAIDSYFSANCRFTATDTPLPHCTINLCACPNTNRRCWSTRRKSRSIEHVGSAHDEAELAALKAAAQRLAAGQAELDLGLARVAGSAPLPIIAWRMADLWDAPCAADEMLGSSQLPRPTASFAILCWPGS
jgi:hypothetical protein